ncbi:hypothetical protein KJ708_09030 [bacterium]|nr:hypothetical protein [bacterium]
MTQKLDVMNSIWDGMTKNKETNTINFKQADIDYLYLNGFVDEKKYDLKTWQQAFNSFKNKKGLYELTKDEFLTLEKFRYTGPVHQFFDAMKITEGPWTQKQLEELYDKSLSQVTDVSKEIFLKYIEECKKKGYTDDKGNLIMSEGVKVGIREFVMQFPTPQQRREHMIHKAKIKEITKNR